MDRPEVLIPSRQDFHLVVLRMNIFMNGLQQFKYFCGPEAVKVTAMYVTGTEIKAWHTFYINSSLS